MKAFCIPKHLASELKQAAQAGDINIKDLYDMTSEQRREVFQKYTDLETAKQINSGFEESIVSSQKDALKKWAEKTFVGKEKQSKQYKDVIDKIDQLDELGALNYKDATSFLEDMVSTRLGASVSADEVKKIVEFTDKLQEISDRNPTNEFGQPSVEYLKARKDLNDYMESLTPSNDIAVLMSTIGRGNMLSSPKSIVTNIIGNSVLGSLEAAQRRLVSGVAVGANGDLVQKYIKEQIKIYKQTEFDLSRMIKPELSPTVLGERQISTQGKGAIKKVARFYEDTIFKYGLGLPDAVYSATAFGDSLNLNSTRLAKQEGKSGEGLKSRAKNLFLDATKLEPVTEEGKKLRDQAIADAMYSTLTNNSMYTKLSTGVRNIFNEATGSLRLGDQLIPFAKTPANVIGTGLDYSGIGFVKAAFEFKSAYTEAKRGNFEKMDRVKTNMIRSGLGLTLGLLVVNLLKPDDYQGDYPTVPKDKALYNLENASADSIRLGDKWVSLDYFGALAPFMRGMLAAKKYGNDESSQQALKYGQSLFGDVFSVPGLDQLKSIQDFVSNNLPEQGGTVQGVKDDLIKQAVDFVSSRTIPAIVGDIAKITDTKERTADYKNPLDSVKARIPGLRQELPAKINVFGEEVSTEQPLSIILFGARLKTAKQGEVIKELDRLQSKNNLPAISDPESTSTKIAEFKGQVSEEKYKEALSGFRTSLKNEFYIMIKSDKYQNADDETKKELLATTRSNVLDDTLKKFGYKAQKKKK